MGLDNCPKCGKFIFDYDTTGCEAPDGQRWCIGHALEELARLRKAAAGMDEVKDTLGEMLRGARLGDGPSAEGEARA